MHPYGYNETLNSNTQDDLIEVYENAGARRPKSSGPENDLRIVINPIQLYAAAEDETTFKKLKKTFKVHTCFYQL